MFYEDVYLRVCKNRNSSSKNLPPQKDTLKYSEIYTPTNLFTFARILTLLPFPNKYTLWMSNTIQQDDIIKHFGPVIEYYV